MFPHSYGEIKMYIIKEEIFKQKCAGGVCLRKSSRNAKCLTDKKQSKCYVKYCKKLNKQYEVDERWEEVKEQIHRRDKTCRIFAILTEEEKNYIYANYYDGYKMLSRTLDVEHIIPRSKNKSLYYDPSNLILISRYFHSLLTVYKHPVFQTAITQEERLGILKRALNSNQISRSQ